ncbi:AarF/ABC1/UbiB kinase family protein [Lacihabitans sp. LS3-19]|uniref:ABC1 kinase family protein n=1 Tax=Lacihabitans sp. LS3-19 TaxID=2487335 RepID=UPI0020CF3BFB|nr:AarF/ABC1/UbiB kinase family protein [Lacihabitans sp. LS3-19]MCP9769625.1 AarF/ABC1/UbiB kinase family protein [Lacihabitans sp. LS3-19]
MKNQEHIPTSKVARATQFVKATAKVGGNYIKHYGKKLIDPSLTKEQLHADNAEDVYEALSNLKGSALKMAQMMSMDKSLLPKAYSDKFAMSQYSAPPLSGPLVVKTFKSSLGKSPFDIFDEFSMDAANAASIGQVHKAKKDGKDLAVKIQYPGVASSISSDLKMARPLAVQLLNLNDAEIDRYFVEVETKLQEEADYSLELKRSMEVTELCKAIPNTFYPKYYPEYSSERIITMDWLEGLHLKEFLATNPSQKHRDQIGQALWDFYHFQMHELKAVHADPHPGNFLFTQDGRLGILDFGCIKVIPEDFYQSYFALINPNLLDKPERMMEIFKELEFILEEDSEYFQQFFFDLFYKMIEILGRPFTNSTFDFGNDDYVKEVYGYFEYVAGIKELKNAKAARGSQHGLYVNRTFFGLYTLLNDLKAKVNIQMP